MSPMLLPITLSTASALTIICLALIVNVARGRWRHRVPMGDGGNSDLLVRMRTHANFTEYVPLLLVLMALLELAGANRLFLTGFGGALIVFRVLHAVGMPRPAPNLYRALGAGGSLLLMILAAGYGLILVATRL